jgi:hypothetical protein
VLVRKHGVAKLLESYSHLTSNNTLCIVDSSNKSISYKYRCGRTDAKVTLGSDKFHGYPSPDRFDDSYIRAGR